MPSVEISFSVSAWWGVALAAQLAWAFLIVAPIYRRVSRRPRFRNPMGGAPYPWVTRATYIVAGPLLWVLGGWEEVTSWRSHRRYMARRASESTACQGEQR